MTREQVHDLMENELRCVQRGNYCDRDCAKCPLVKDDKELIEAYGYVIKALEQQPILDKVRAEIMDTGAYEQEVNGNTEFLKGINYCLSVVDKYKAESEGKE